MAWRVARSLLILRDQIDTAYPGRSKASDGTIGDAAHQAQISDHNPDRFGVVRALDITHDPGRGCDIDILSDALIGSRDSRISYVIANRLISGPLYDWKWGPYYGDDPHTNHLHLSVVGDARADDTRPWDIGQKPRENGGEMFVIHAGHVFEVSGSEARWVPSEAVFGGDYNRVIPAATVEDVGYVYGPAPAGIPWLRRTPAAAGTVDLGALADAVVARLAARLQS